MQTQDTTFEFLKEGAGVSALLEFTSSEWRGVVGFYAGFDVPTDIEY